MTRAIVEERVDLESNSLMQTSQAKPHSSDKVAAKTTETSQKVAMSGASTTRVPAWANTSNKTLPAGLQTKLTISQPGDTYEQEAGSIAEQVMRIPASLPLAAPPDTPAPSPQLATAVSHIPPMIQRQAVEGDTLSSPTTPQPASEAASTPATTATESAPTSATPNESAAPGLIVDDSADQLQPGQMRKSDFLAQLKDAVCSTAEEALKGTIWSAMGCPWVEHWFGYYSGRDGQQIERALRRYAPETANATSAGDYIPIICGRVRQAIAVWSTTGEVTGVPEGMELPDTGLMGVAGSIASGIASVGSSIVSGAESVVSGIASAGASLVKGVGSALSSIGSLFSKGKEGGAREASNPQAIQGQLGAGRSLEGGVRSQMESAFGADFSHVRVHTGATASGLSENLNARAFTIGQDVAFGPGEYRPGTLVGDALIAHELAHVVQQGGAISSQPMQKGETAYDALEEDADRSAVGAMVSLWNGAKGGLTNVAQNAMPNLRSGLGLQRCATARSSVRGPEVVRPPVRGPDTAQGGPQNAQQRQRMSIITNSMPAYEPPDPVPDVSQQLAENKNIGKVDTSRVPPDEVSSVRYGILQAANINIPRESTVELRNAYWPVTLRIRRGANVESVRYELVFDNARNVRADRLGPATPRQVAPEFAKLDKGGKKRQLERDFGLAKVEDRTATWEPPQLDQVKAAFDLIPQRDRDALRGFTLLRDHQGPVLPNGQTPGGITHIDPNPALDQPGPQVHAPPHIHYYDIAFDQNKLLSVGPPGATGPGGDWALLHEVGHARIDLAILTADTAVRDARRRLRRSEEILRATIGRLPLNQAQQRAWNAWRLAMEKANRAIVAFNDALSQTPPASQDQQAPLLQAAQKAVQARNLARAGLADANLPQGLLQAVADLDRANDDLLTANQQRAAGEEQIPIFVSLANRFKFHKFTDFAIRSADSDSDWFAETYALYLTNPNRLDQMNHNIFLWLEAGMPMDQNWNPPAH